MPPSLRFPTAESFYQPGLSSRPDKPAEWVLDWFYFERDEHGRLVRDVVGDQLVARRRSDRPVGDAPKRAEPARVRFDVDRWLVDCPNPDCASAQYASWSDRRFFCVDCDNGHVGGRWLPVEWPDDPEGIEAVMLVRPAKHRLMAAGETLAELRDENVAQGFPPAEGEDPLTGSAREAAVARWRDRRLAGLSDAVPAWPFATPPPDGYVEAGRGGA